MLVQSMAKQEHHLLCKYLLRKPGAFYREVSVHCCPQTSGVYCKQAPWYLELELEATDGNVELFISLKRMEGGIDKT